MGLTATATSVPGSLRQDVVVDGTHRLVTDEPPSVGGDGSAAAPHELLAAAIAACVGTTIVMYARRREWDVGEVTVDVDYDHRVTPRHVDVRISLDGDLEPGQVERLEAVAAACPVRRSLESAFVFDESVAATTPHQRGVVAGGTATG